jgi:hypothetical protein
MQPSGGETCNYCANNGDLVMLSGGISHKTGRRETVYRETDEEAGSCELGRVYPWLNKFRRNKLSHDITSTWENT